MNSFLYMTRSELSSINSHTEFKENLFLKKKKKLHIFTKDCKFVKF